MPVRRALGLLLSAVLALAGLAAVPGVAAAAAPGVWEAAGEGSSTVSDGTGGDPQLAYDLRGPFAGSWTFTTTAATAGTVRLPWTWTGFHSYFQVTTSLVATVERRPEGQRAWTTVSSDELVAQGPVDCCTAPSGGFEYAGTTDFTVQPGDRFGFRLAGSHFDRAPVLSGTFTVSRDPDEPNTTWPAARVLGTQDTTTDRLRLPGQARWYRFPVQPDSVVQVDLEALAADYDLTLFRDIGQAFSSATSVSDLALLNAEFAADAFSPSVFSPSVFSPSVFSPSVFSPSVFSPSVFSPSVFSPSVFSPSVFSPSVFSPDVSLGSTIDPAALAASGLDDEQLAQAFSSAQVRSLVAVSARDGLAPESIRASTWNATGFFYVRVEGRNGAFDATSPYTLRVTSTGGACGVPLDTFTGEESLRGDPDRAPRTVVLTDSDRLPGTAAEVGATLADLQAFADRTEVDGVVVDAATLPRLRSLNGQADALVDCPAAKNLVAAELREIVNSFRTAGPDGGGETLRYVVVAGDDAVVPFVRQADAAGLGPEENFTPPVAEGTSSQSALRTNRFLTQDAYGSRVDLTLKGATIAVPDVAVGRLVETPGEIRGALARYVATGGLLQTPSSGLVTGYDFLTDAADEVAAQLRAGLGAGGTTTELITDAGVPTTTTTVDGVPSRSTSWTADDLRTALRARPHDVVYLAGHFSANSALAADDRTSVVTTELAGADVDLTDSLVLSAGCHSGYTVVDGHAVPGLTLGLDWTQLMARKGATFVAGTGYQYGDTDFLEYSERLYADLVAELREGQGAVAVGEALLRAKQDYLATTPVLSGIHQKALAQATLYGLPMTGVDLPSGRTDVPVEPEVTPTPVDEGPGAQLDLAEADVSQAVPTTAQTKADPDVPGGVLSWIEGPDGVLTSPGQPALPLQTLEVGVADAAVRGVLLLGGRYAERGGVVPLTGAAATEYSAPNPAFASAVDLPRRLVSANGLAQVAGDGGTRLFLTPAQYRTDTAAGAAAGTAVERRWQRLDVRLLYSGNTSTYSGNVPALAAPPAISDVRSVVTGDVASGAVVTVQARVVGDPSAGIQEVHATWTAARGPAFGVLDSLALTQSGQDSTLWTGDIRLAPGQDPGDVRFVVQAVNGVGLVSVEDNQGLEFRPGSAPGLDPLPATAAAVLTLDAPSQGVTGGEVPVAATVTAGGQPLAGRVVTFGLGGRLVPATTGADGVARVTLRLVEGVGRYTLTADFAGDDVAGFAAASAPVDVTARSTELALSGPGSPVLAGFDPGVTATLTSGGTPLVERSVYLVVERAGVVVSTTLQRTDVAGRVRLDRTDLPVGTLRVTAYAADPAVPLPNGTTFDAREPDLAPAVPVSLTLTVARAVLGPFQAPVVDGTAYRVARTGSVPVRIALLGPANRPVSDLAGVLLAATCSIRVTAPTGAGTPRTACLSYDRKDDRFEGTVSGRSLGWRSGQTFSVRVDVVDLRGRVLTSRSTPVQVS